MWQRSFQDVQITDCANSQPQINFELLQNLNIPYNDHLPQHVYSIPEPHYQPHYPVNYQKLNGNQHGSFQANGSSEQWSRAWQNDLSRPRGPVWAPEPNRTYWSVNDFDKVENCDVGKWRRNEKTAEQRQDFTKGGAWVTFNQL